MKKTKTKKQKKKKKNMKIIVKPKLELCWW